MKIKNMKNFFKQLPLIPSNDNEVGRDACPEKKENSINRVALATVTQIDLGIKALSGSLQKEGFEVGKFNLLKEDGFSEEELEAIIEKFKGYDIIGISATDLGFDSRIVPMLRMIKEKLQIPVVLGGTHAILDPIDCLKKGADAVCLGEGDYDFVNLLKNWRTREENEIRNFILRDDKVDYDNEGDVGKLKEKIKTLRNVPVEKINELTPDFSYHNYWALRGGQLVELTAETMDDFSHHQIGHKNTIVYASDRGCPHSCTYCYNRNMRETYKESAEEQGLKTGVYHRRKDIKVIIKELEELKKENPQIEFMNLMNDDTAARSLEELQEFAKLYKEKIGWPFYCMVSPQAISGKSGHEKVKALIDAGMKELNMGIQTNSKTNREIFGRVQPDEMVLDVVKMLNEFSRKDPRIKEYGKIDVFFDFIIHNPFESEEDIRKTINLIKHFPIPFDQVSHSLFVGRTTVLRKMLDKKQAKAKEHGESVDRVLEDGIGESDYHDTHKFYDWLKGNKNFEINTLMEFMAGRHDDSRTGRIPRLVKDLLLFPAFKELFDSNAESRLLTEEIAIPEKMLSIDFLSNERVLGYFKDNKDVFKTLISNMDNMAKIRYTNQQDNYGE